MFRIAAVTLCLVASSAQADGYRAGHHMHHHGYSGSFSNPINYRPNRTPDVVVVRTPNYSEGNTVIIKRSKAGVTTGMSVVPPQGITGQNLAGLELHTLPNN